MEIDYNAFGDAIETKIGREIIGEEPPVGIPEPTSLAIFGFGALTLGAFRRRKVLPASTQNK